ncbi:T9SS type A sorting domain-containing protein [Tunicatimonas pelagia]|uniref:T9SS type A sorting domain-containing protein n=1 Tax=Tunicatimonas pelagia TaxID=931531 RepID=UPI002665FDB9|nr:T9SS type A sorting domain-containing protein [Tunicatimonas pelagia]WKN40563.1 T9SS type A sorting domain-containing protein [Tunicatimonas pelagia]
MKTKNLTYNLEQRISYLGYQKLEEEVLFEKLREKMSQPIPEDKYSSTTLRQCSFEHIITKFLFITTFIITAFDQGWCQTDEEIINQFDRKQLELDNGFELPYYTFTSTAPKPKNGYPLIVGLHGTGEMIDLAGPGSHLTRREVIKGWITPDVQDKYAPYVLAPQLSLDLSWGEEDINTALDAIIQTLIDEGTVDPDRIYVLGHSVGGFGAWAFPVVSKIPVAAIAPMSGFWFSGEEGNPSVKEARDVLSEISVWAFQHASEIDPRSSTNTRAIVTVLEKDDLPFVVNAQPHLDNNILNSTHLYTEYTSETLPCSGVECHRVCDVVIKDPIFIEWLFQQRRGRPPAKVIQITNIDTVSSVSSVSWAIENQENSVAIYFQPVNSEEWILLGQATGSKENYQFTSLSTVSPLRGKLRVDALNTNNEVYSSDTSALVTLKQKLITDVPSEVTQTTVVVYPNPTKDVLYWRGTDRFNEGTYSIVDVLGRVVAKGPVAVDGVSVAQLATGSYLLALRSSRHLGEIVRIRFLKQ